MLFQATQNCDSQRNYIDVLFVFLYLPKIFEEMCGQGYLSQPGCVCVYSEELWWLCWCILLRCEFHICNTVLVHISSLRESRLSSLVGAEGFRNIFSIHLDLIELLSLGLIVGPFPQNCWFCCPVKPDWSHFQIGSILPL